MGIRRIKLAQILPLRAVLALAFIVLSSLQPGLFASANATGFHADNGIALSVQIRDHHATHTGHGDHAKSVADEQVDHHGSKAKDASCEVHCVPIHGVPASCADVFPPSVGCVPEETQLVLQPGEPAELKRPPRT
jgi:hypothetical protein